MDRIFNLIDNLATRYLTVALINYDPVKFAELLFNEYKDNTDELLRILKLIKLHEKHIKYYNYRAFLNKINSLSLTS